VLYFFIHNVITYTVRFAYYGFFYGDMLLLLLLFDFQCNDYQDGISYVNLLLLLLSRE
jgi:hypothetical protein